MSDDYQPLQFAYELTPVKPDIPGAIPEIWQLWFIVGDRNKQESWISRGQYYDDELMNAHREGTRWVTAELAAPARLAAGLPPYPDEDDDNEVPY